MNSYYLFDRRIWERHHFSDRQPIEWQCGKCYIGQLRASTDYGNNMLRNRAAKSFVCQLKCTNSECHAIYFASGKWGKFDNLGTEISINYEGENCRRYFFPTSFVPILPLFSLTPGTPPSLTKSIQEAFSLYWLSPDACANAIRSSLECLLDAQNIPVPNGRNLHSRIEKFKTIDSRNAEMLLAIKWIGNFGSHERELDRNDVLDAFDLLASVLLNLYPDTGQIQRLEHIKNSINTTGKPRSKNT
jgi:hypothetical protein